MGILEIHFHDSEFHWSMNPGSGEKRSLSLRSGGSGESATTDGGEERERPDILPKLRSVAVMAFVVGAGVAYNRLKDRRARRAAEAAEEETRGGRFSRLRSR